MAVVRHLLAAGALAALAGCPIDRFNHYDRPAHAEIGLNTRHFAGDPTAVAERTTTPPENPTVDGTAASVSFRFTMKMRWNAWAGGEAEAGAFTSRSGSNLAGGYGVIGGGAPFRLGTFGAELAAGWRSVRESVEAPDVARAVLEPRVRGELWLSPQITLGSAVGADLTGQHAWMAGVYVGVHSHSYGRDTPNR
jgi:hypothetical protein